MTNRDLGVSIVRTIVPVVVGLLLSAAAKAGIELDDTSVAAVVDAVAVGFYYSIVRWAEDRWPQVGWLLGLKAPPHYDGPTSRQR